MALTCMGSNAAQPTRKRSSHGGELVGSPRGVEDLVGVSKIRKPPFSGAKMLVPGRVKHKRTWTFFLVCFRSVRKEEAIC